MMSWMRYGQLLFAKGRVSILYLLRTKDEEDHHSHCNLLSMIRVKHVGYTPEACTKSGTTPIAGVTTAARFKL